ncbi:MAG: transketolase [Thalassospira sp.]|uniref:transketolase n=1 Tax=Thalassospira TaxID=168934 RepID=UPI0002872D70|nr:MULTISPECIES: transketolase [Thalassospira]BDW96518.1 transketolase [Thalassospira tepidiphila]EKF07276.1 transketolase [Thalassospira profundimaris WP0211]MBO6578553.1 transketolase [Thalassospira sp.]MBO6804490.1 transketolase [Thalassospira sp.]MBO6818836.1 transketolase [Thalassospira sp.]
MTTQVEHNRMANAIRFLSADAVEKAKSGHPGMPMGMADVATVLYTKFLKFDPKHPNWPDRDRFILSAGHGSMLLYSLLHLTGYEDFDLDQIKNFRQMGYRTAGHPEYGHGEGIETTTGPLGQGIATSVGFALGERIMNARFGDSVVDHYTYVIAGDGCLMEGISQEAISMAGHMKLSKLIVLFDDNGISIDGPTSLSTSEDHKKRFEAAGWDVQQIDGHDPAAIEAAIAKAKTTNTPSMIACKTEIGFGAPTKGGTSATHGSPLGAEELAGARKKLGWDSEPFEIPADVRDAWLSAGARGAEDFNAWGSRFEGLEAALKDEFERRIEGKLPENWIEAFNDYKKQITEDKPKVATRKASENVLEVLTKAIPEMIGGSADLTGSNNTKTSVQAPITADGGYEGGYIYYGIREHGMAAAMNGLALHGGVLPYGGTFLVFTDYCRPAIRLSALMNQRVVYVMTHDSIGLGEDGPTHQPVEHVASLRAMPNVTVIRPADAVETAEAWAMSITNETGPTVLALTRQNLPVLRTEYREDNLVARGGYVISDCDGDRQVTLIATGSEVEIAMDAQAKLKADGINAAVVSLPSWELFDAQSPEYRKDVLGSAPRVAIEALSVFGWEKYVGDNGKVIGMHGFGASAPAPVLYEHFGITADALVKAAKELV